MEKKIVLLAAALVVLVIAGYFYYPNILEEDTGGMAGRAVDMGIAPKAAQVQTAFSGTVTREGGAPYASATVEEVVEVPGREISVTVHLSLTVEDIRRAATEAMKVTTSLGGYVQSSSISDNGGYLTLKVPRNNLDEALSLLRSLGKVEKEELSTIDLTSSIMDVEARLRNAKTEEERLLELLDKAETVNEILEVESRLSSVREKIERLEAMRKGMERKVDYATIQVMLRKKGMEPNEFRDILDKISRDAWRAFTGSIYILVVGGAFLVVPGAIVTIVYLLLKRKKQ